MIRHSLAATLLALGALAVSGQTPASKLHKHESGLEVRLPANWSTQDGGEGLILLPPGVTFDPNRQDNVELYVAATDTGYRAADEKKFVEDMSGGFPQQGAALVRSGEREGFTAGGRAAAAYTWEMRDPAAAKTYLLKIYIAPVGERAFVVVAIGDSERVRGRDAALRQVLAGMDYAAPSK